MGPQNPLHPHSIVPIIINGDEASLGTPISFPYLGYGDMASYQDAQISVNIKENLDTSPISSIKTIPNPFPSSTTISYDLSQPSIVQISFFNHLGQQVDFIRQNQSRCKQQITWDASNHPPGIYFARIQTADATATIKLIRKH